MKVITEALVPEVSNRCPKYTGSAVMGVKDAALLSNVDYE